MTVLQEDRGSSGIEKLGIFRHVLLGTASIHLDGHQPPLHQRIHVSLVAFRPTAAMLSAVAVVPARIKSSSGEKPVLDLQASGAVGDHLPVPAGIDPKIPRFLSHCLDVREFALVELRKTGRIMEALAAGPAVAKLPSIVHPRVPVAQVDERDVVFAVGTAAPVGHGLEYGLHHALVDLQPELVPGPGSAKSAH